MENETLDLDALLEEAETAREQFDAMETEETTTVAPQPQPEPKRRGRKAFTDPTDPKQIKRFVQKCKKHLVWVEALGDYVRVNRTALLECLATAAQPGETVAAQLTDDGETLIIG